MGGVPQIPSGDAATIIAQVASRPATATWRHLAGGPVSSMTTRIRGSRTRWTRGKATRRRRVRRSLTTSIRVLPTGSHSPTTSTTRALSGPPLSGRLLGRGSRQAYRPQWGTLFPLHRRWFRASPSHAWPSGLTPPQRPGSAKRWPARSTSAVRIRLTVFDATRSLDPVEGCSPCSNHRFRRAWAPTHHLADRHRYRRPCAEGSPVALPWA